MRVISRRADFHYFVVAGQFGPAMLVHEKGGLFMCGRYAYAISNLGRWGAVFKVVLEDFVDKYNIAPSAMVPVFTINGWQKMRWGLVPAWAKEPQSKYATFNARVETFRQKPMFRNAWKEKRRCLVPLSGYYEWKKEKDHKKVYYITSTLEEPLVIAGLWERWRDGDSELLSCTLLTTAAQEPLHVLHHRMPVIIEPDQGPIWLGGEQDEAMDVLRNPSLRHIRYHRVSDDVGNPRHQGSKLIRQLP